MIVQNILLVEDSDDDADLTTMAFQAANIANPVIRMRDGVDALDYLLARGTWSTGPTRVLPALVLLDL
jgi:two-component system response regulator